MEGKNSFLLYCDMIHIFEELTDEQAGQLVKIIFKYVNDQNPEVKDQVLKVSFAPIKAKLKRDLQEWLAICERNKRNGGLGGRPPKNLEVIEKPKKPSGLSGNPKNPVKPDNDKDIDKDIEKDNENVNEENHNQIFRNLYLSEMWIEQTAMKFKSEKERIREVLNEFRIDCILKGDLKEDEKDTKKHFINWLNVSKVLQQPIQEKPRQSQIKNNHW